MSECPLRAPLRALSTLLAAVLVVVAIAPEARADDAGLDAACANLTRLAATSGEEAPTADELVACKRDLGLMNASCSNGDAVIACIAAVDGESADAIGDAFLECAMLCQEAGTEPPATGALTAGVQNACDNLSRLALAAGEEVRPGDMPECLEGVGELVRECSNGEAVLGCFASAASEDAFVACIDRCVAD